MATDPFKSLTVTYQPGDRIIEASEQGACMFVIQKGNVRLLRPALDGDPIEIATLEKGDFFGEGGLLDGKAYGVAAEAITESEIVEIGASTFQRMLRANPEVAVRMLRKMSNRLALLETKVVAQGPGPAASPTRKTAALSTPESAVSAQVPAAAGSAEIEAARTRRSARLLIEGAGTVFPLAGKEMLIGRYDPITEIQPEIDLSSADTKRSVSRRHARLTWRDDAWYISEEIGALNGTFVNGTKLKSAGGAPLRDSDVVSVGMVRLVYRES
jgi:CRP-like cAMP-binding protein